VATDHLAQWNRDGGEEAERAFILFVRFSGYFFLDTFSEIFFYF
jgi:hypothetical protein